jgi:Fe-S-cluster containining protein
LEHDPGGPGDSRASRQADGSTPAAPRPGAETARQADYTGFRRYLKTHHRRTHERLYTIAREIERRTDCRACVRCCRETVVEVTSEDIERIARTLGLGVDETRRRYTTPEPGDLRHWLLRNEHDACIFLEGNLCSIYDGRPGPCRDFPHVTGGAHTLGSRIESICRHAEFCPILEQALDAYEHACGYARR